MREIWLDPDYVDDPLLQEYLDGTWAPLVAAARKLGNISDDTSERFACRPSWCGDKSITPSRCPAASSACTWA